MLKAGALKHGSTVDTFVGICTQHFKGLVKIMLYIKAFTIANI